MVLERLAAAGLSPAEPALWICIAAALVAALFGLEAERASRRARRLRGELERARISAAAAEERAADLIATRSALGLERDARAGLEAALAAASARASERESALAELKQRMDADFQAAAAKMLEVAHQSFLQRANETFERHRESAGADAERRRTALDELLKPVGATLQRYEAGLADLRATQQKERGELLGRIGDLAKASHDVRQEAHRLATALRSGSKVRGRWGEEQLRNVVELAGMSAHVDFVEQRMIEGERRLMPDMIVNLPGGRKIAIDAKVSINAYLDAMEAETEPLRAERLARHADDLWTHVKTLSARGYAEGIKDGLDFVVMFVPGENYFAAAMEARPQLFQDAFARKILVATPTTLVAMLKATSITWRQEKSAVNAAAVASLAKDLYESLRTMSEHFGSLGRSLEASVAKYNAAIGSLEQRVLPRARRFAEYEMPGIDGAIADLLPIDTPPRRLRDAHGLEEPEAA